MNILHKVLKKKDQGKMNIPYSVLFVILKIVKWFLNHVITYVYVRIVVSV